MRRAPDDARGSDGARGGVDLIHASLSSAEKVDIARARAARHALGRGRASERHVPRFIFVPWARRRPADRMKVTK